MKKTEILNFDKKFESFINDFNNGSYETVLEKGLLLCKEFPERSDLFNVLGVTYKKIGNFNLAVKNLKKAIDLNPSFFIAMYNLGNLFNENNKKEKAIELYQKVIEVNPSYSMAFNNCAMAYRDLNQPDMAMECLLNAINADKKNYHALSNIGILHIEKANYEEAVSFFIRSIKINSRQPYIWENLANVMSVIPIKEYDAQKVEIFIVLLEKKNLIQPRKVVFNIINLIKLDPQFATLAMIIKNDFNNKNLKKIFEIINNMPLFLKILKYYIIPDIEIENILTKLRKKILMHSSADLEQEIIINFQKSLAFNCFINEYILTETKDETKKISILEKEINNIFQSKKIPELSNILSLLSYRDLKKYKWFSFLKKNFDIQDIYKAHIEDFYEEKEIKSKILSINKIKNYTSLKVKDQYENNPYPRWVTTRINKTPLSLESLIRDLRLDIIDDLPQSFLKPLILVAGCGTGQHSIGVANRIENSKIEAIDLSFSSLSYAIRKTKELEIKNIKYFQADILELAEFKNKYDIIESVGVLHHMENPMEGWKTLVKCLRPKGLMKIGLYSKFAREKISFFKKNFVNKELLGTKSEIIEYRKKILQSNNPELFNISQSSDFYTTSSFRDLLLHTQEHQFTLIHIKKSLFDLGLKFCGFEIADKNIIKEFEKIYPEREDFYNLEIWHNFEKENKDIFSGMYQFWVQKI
jgi:2-polyprenyl-3-methyl-5-hydroxy-6-metoxy-1,4-benzoquinol methylase/Flp pilus assembly protein TadD